MIIIEILKPRLNKCLEQVNFRFTPANRKIVYAFHNYGTVGPRYFTYAKKIPVSSPEELPSVRSAHGLPLVEDGGVPGQEGRVADVLVTHDPAEVGGGPPHVAGANSREYAFW